MTQNLFDVRFDSYIEMNETDANSDGLVPFRADWQSHCRSVARDYCLIKSSPSWKPCADLQRSHTHTRTRGARVQIIDSRFTSNLRCILNIRTGLSSGGKWLRCVKWRINGMKKRREKKSNAYSAERRMKQRVLRWQNAVVVAVDSTKCLNTREKCNDLWLRKTHYAVARPFSPNKWAVSAAFGNVKRYMRRRRKEEWVESERETNKQMNK